MKSWIWLNDWKLATFFLMWKNQNMEPWRDLIIYWGDFFIRLFIDWLGITGLLSVFTDFSSAGFVCSMARSDVLVISWFFFQLKWIVEFDINVWVFESLRCIRKICTWWFWFYCGFPVYSDMHDIRMKKCVLLCCPCSARHKSILLGHVEGWACSHGGFLFFAYFNSQD